MIRDPIRPKQESESLFRRSDDPSIRLTRAASDESAASSPITSPTFNRVNEAVTTNSDLNASGKKEATEPETTKESSMGTCCPDGGGDTSDQPLHRDDPTPDDPADSSDDPADDGDADADCDNPDGDDADSDDFIDDNPDDTPDDPPADSDSDADADGGGDDFFGPGDDRGRDADIAD